MKNEMERNLVMKMAKLCEQWYEPYDEIERRNCTKNKEITIKYDVYKELLLELWGIKKD